MEHPRVSSFEDQRNPQRCCFTSEELSNKRCLGFLNQFDVTDHHGLIHSLAHVIQGQGSNRHRRERFHLNTGGSGDTR